MKRIKNKLIITSIFVLSFILFMNGVSAGLWGNSDKPSVCSNCGGGGGGGEATHRPVAFGYRVTLVNAKGKTVSNTYSVDFWPGKGWETSNTGYNFLKSKTKTHGNGWMQYFNNQKVKTEGSSSLTVSKTYSPKHIAYDFIVESNYKIVKSTYSGCSNLSSKKITNVEGGATGDECYNNNYTKFALEATKYSLEHAKTNTTQYNLLAKMLKSTGFEVSKSNKEVIVDATKNNYYLVVEPVSAILRYTFNGYNDFVTYIGTSRDLYLMNFYTKTSSKSETSNYTDGRTPDNGPYRWAFSYYSYLHPIVYVYGKSGSIAGLEKKESFSSKVLPSLLSTNSGSLGAYVFNISDYIDDPETCNDNARKIVNKYFSNGELKSGKTEQDYLKALYNDSEAKECVTYSNNKYTLKDKCNALDPLSIKVYKGIGVKNACSSVSCGHQVSKESNGLLKNYSDANTVEKISNELYQYWKNRGKEYIKLKRYFYENFTTDQKPFCGNPNFTCDPVSGKISNCSADVTFSDNANKDCWAKGVAYNLATNPNNLESYQSSRDNYLSPTYGNKCDVYCIETVKFDLPNDQSDKAYGAKAGKVFKWGVNKDKNDSLFGTMTITRECKPIGVEASACAKKTINPAYWVNVGTGTGNYINTIVSLNYAEKVSKRVIDSEDLKTSLVSYTINNKKPISNKITTNGKFTVTADYRFDYGKKLHWYSDKGNNFKSVTEDSISSKLPSNQYVEIGYGLPTDFTEPTNVYSIKWTDDKGFDEEVVKKSNNGYMYATIKNIGTKNTNSKGGYHFDQLVKDNSSKAGFFKDGTLKYTCDYNIENELFGYECKDTDNDPLYCDKKQSPKGIDVAFRTIELVNTNSSDKEAELNKAFPGRSGNGREIGRNWYIWLNGNPNDKTDKTNLYDILNNNVYDKKPLYKITLNSSTISKIRKYNKKARNSKNSSIYIDPYTFMGDIKATESNGYAGYKCVKADGKKYAYCASNFLTQLKNDSSINYSGECVINADTNKRATNFSKKICE